MQAGQNSKLNSDYESNQGCHSDVRVSHPTYSDNNPNPTLNHCHTGLYSAVPLPNHTAACDSARVVSGRNDSGKVDGGGEDLVLLPTHGRDELRA